MIYYIIKCKQTGKYAGTNSIGVSLGEAQSFKSIKDAKCWIRTNIKDWQKWITVRIVEYEKKK